MYVMRIKSVFLERTKPRKPLKLQELRGFCSKVRFFLLTYSARIAWIGSRLAALIAGIQPKQIPQILAITMLNNTPPA